MTSTERCYPGCWTDLGDCTETSPWHEHRCVLGPHTDECRCFCGRWLLRSVSVSTGPNPIDGEEP